MKQKKAIIFNCYDNWGENYRFVVVCSACDVYTTLNEYMSKSTEIQDYEVVDALFN